MFDRSKTPLKSYRRTRNAIGIVALSFVAAFLMMLTVSQSHACPPGTDAKASLPHKLKLKAVTASDVVMTASSIPGSDRAAGVGSCCGGGPRSNNSGCSHGCCVSGVALLDAGPNIPDEWETAGYRLPPDGQMTLADPDPNFRPPCLA